MYSRAKKYNSSKINLIDVNISEGVFEKSIEALNRRFELSEIQKKRFKDSRDIFNSKKIYPEVYELLAYLQRSYKLSIVSNYTSDLIDYLKE